MARIIRDHILRLDGIKQIDKSEHQSKDWLDQYLIVELFAVEITDFVKSKQAEMEKFAELAISLYVVNEIQRFQAFLN